MNTFFDKLGDQLNQQFLTGENKLKTLNLVKDGKIIPYGKLGDAAKNFDLSAERSYYEDGMRRNSLLDSKPKAIEILTQEPDISVIVKKRAFSSLAENYRSDILDQDERLTIRATKFLFQNKAKQIAAYEQLTKIEAVSQKIGYVDYHLLPTLFNTVDFISTTSNTFFNGNSSGFQKFKNVVDRVRTAVNLSNAFPQTTWITNLSNSFRGDAGEGTGVIEFTNVSNIGTTTSINFGSGSGTLSFNDPYKLMVITNNDIEQAISDAVNPWLGNDFFKTGLNILNDGIEKAKEKMQLLRSRRNASAIDFRVNPDTFLGQRVRAVISESGKEIKFDGSVINVNVDTSSLLGNALGNDGLSSEELQLFGRIVRSLYNAIQTNANSKTIAVNHNESTNKIRKKLKLYYGGKLLIQPMDVVSIFISSKAKTDSKVLGGLQDNFNSLGFLQGANKTFLEVKDFFNAANGLSVEKSIFVGSDFPNWLWTILKNQFTVDRSGTCVFSGLVSHSSSSFSGGYYKVQATLKDNAEYFNFGVVNFKPSVEVYNESLYDPLTPFNIKFDELTGRDGGFDDSSGPQLLEENKVLFGSSFVKYKNGIYVGRKPTEKNFIQDSDRLSNGFVRKVFYDPDGFVYKWKEGIGTVSLFGNAYNDGTTKTSGTPSLTQNPFAGQDIMNALSLLICGEPYNYTTFYKAASEFQGFARDPKTGLDPAVSYFRNLQQDLKNRNVLYGNFVPFKTLTLDEDSFKNIINNITNVNQFNSELKNLISRKAELQDKIAPFFLNKDPSSVLSTDSDAVVNTISQQIKAIDNDIATITKSINDNLNKIGNKPISIIGSDVSTDYSGFLDTGKNDFKDGRRRELRKKINFLTKKLSWKARANEDVSLFIVDDTYDKDYDIQAFSKAFTNVENFKSDFISVAEQIKQISGAMDMEVFADTQGNIRIRPPQYNKIPSSVFYRMLALKQELGIQVYPKFLEDLYLNQISGALKNIGVIEDQIRAYCLALGNKTDSECEKYISQNNPDGITVKKEFIPFKFVSDESNGKALIGQYALMDYISDPRKQRDDIVSKLDEFSKQANLNNIFNLSVKDNLIKKLVPGAREGYEPIFRGISPDGRLAQLKSRIENETSIAFDINQLFTNSDKLLGSQYISSSDLLNISNLITDKIKERQVAIKIAVSSIKNATEAKSINDNSNRIDNKILAPDIFANKKIPQALEHMIQDESYDDYGPGSGSRYIIKDYQILSYTIDENPPNGNVINVSGSYADNFNVEAPQGLGVDSENGNGLSSASAIDYDLARMYGMRFAQNFSANFLSDPKTQLEPFAVSILNKIRKTVLRGNISIAGNEYMQPGDVIYLEDRDLLFYVESVQHSFTYGGRFQTTLNIAYGHSPGEYIPTWLDVVGKALFKNKDLTNYVHKKQNSFNNEQHLGTIIGDTSVSLIEFSSTTPDEALFSGPFKDINRKEFIKILQGATSAFASSGQFNQPFLEIRVYYNSHSTFISPTQNATDLAEELKKILLGGSDNSDLMSIVKTAELPFLKNNEKFIKLIQVDASAPGETRSPSSSAYGLARQAVSKKSIRTSTAFSQKQLAEQIDSVIHDYVIDCWITFKPSGESDAR